MRKVATVAAIVCLAPAGLGFGPPALIESQQALAPLYSEQVAAIRGFQPPSFSAASALVVEGRSGVTLLARDATAQRPMASLTKVMTALLALERGQLDRLVRVDVDASQLDDSSVIGLRPGEELTLEDLLYGLLLPSGNDAALAVAGHLGGSVARFVDLMNQRAAELGLVNTHFANPHGLDAPEHYSSAADLVRLARTAMANPTFAKIVSTRERTVRGKLATYELRNTNRLLGTYPGVDGVKTGSTEGAGECLVTTAQRGEERIFTAVLGSTSRFTDTRDLLDYSYGSFLCQRLPMSLGAFYGLPPGPAEPAATDAGQPDRQTDGGGSVYVVQPPWDCRPSWQARWLHAELLWAEQVGGKQDRAAGKVSFYLGDLPVAETPVERP